MDPIIEKLKAELRAKEMQSEKIRDSHLHKRRGIADSRMTYVDREPTIVVDNRSLFGSHSVVGVGQKPNKPKNKKVGSSKGFCSMFC